MQDLSNILDHLRRPRLLIRAARIGAQEFSRSKHLPALLGFAPSSLAERTVPALLELEADMDARRREQDATYSPRRHVELLVALIAEARRLRSMAQP